MRYRKGIFLSNTREIPTSGVKSQDIKRINATYKRGQRTIFSENSKRQTSAEGRNKDLAWCRLTSEVKPRGDGMCPLAASLALLGTLGFCVKTSSAMR